MDDVVKQLLNLRDADNAIYGLRRALTERPAAVEMERRALASAEASLQDLQQQIRALQMIVDKRNVELAQADGVVQKLIVQQGTLKTNAEYSAMQKQIEGKREEIRSLEDRILEAMEVVEDAKRQVPGRKAEIETKRHLLEQALVALDIEMKRLGDELASGQVRRAELAAALPEDILRIYNSQLDRYKKDAVAAVDSEGICQGCHTKTTSQVANMAMAGHAIQCNNCERLLYMP